ncbi:MULTISPECIES: hypothetical protein [unclassified Empedobacter]|uniref:hypothetical protein n=1 Tax=unclassified Empedobacter TaxID=2643773 RepID=UPI0025C0D433|nr:MULTISPECIES: hypothetical protein [unclassified Empedobacter]
MDKAKNSQVATGGSTISNSNNTSQNKNSHIDNSELIKKVRKESMIISFIVGVLTSLVSSYIFEHFLK